jgi:hypothetical protein
LTSLSFPALINCNSFHVNHNPGVTTLSLPSLQNINSDFYSLNNSLTTLTFPALTTFAGEYFDCTANALPSSEVNSLLATFVALGSTPLNNINLNSQNPPAPPTGKGIIDKNILIGLGKNVNTD